MSCVLLSIRT